MMRRRHGWQRPFHPLQIIGAVIYSVLVTSFYVFLGFFLGNRIAIITLLSIFTFVAVSVIILFVRCTAIDPTDKTSLKKKRKAKSKGVLMKIRIKVVLSQVIIRFFRRLERKILRNFIRRTYLDPWQSSVMQIEQPLLPFPLVMKEDDDSVTPEVKEEDDDISYCSLCDLEVKRSSKHCRTCNRCVEGFDHHCRWLNNCVGKRNYNMFILLMVFVLLMLIIEGGTAIAIFVRCFVNKNGIETDLKRRLYVEFPRWLLATISVVLVLFTAYGSAAMGQLFLFHVVLIRKGMRTYDYILAMKEENEFTEMDAFDELDSSSSDESSDFDSPERSSTFISKFICTKANESRRLSIKIEGDDDDASTSTMMNKKPGFRVSINPWKLITISSEKALEAAEKAKERLRKSKPVSEEDNDSIKPLPLETKFGLLLNQDKNTEKFQVSPVRFSSPRRRFSGSGSGCSSSTTTTMQLPSPKQKYRSNFDLKLTEVSRELESYISRQVLCSVIKQDGNEASPR